MKKLLIVIGLLVIGGMVLISYVQSKLEVDVSSADLPQDVYQNDGDLLLIAQQKLIDIVNPLNMEDDYTLTEEFLNYMLLYSIRENVNADYNPLDDTCDTTACQNIVETDYGNVQYAYTQLTEENQLLVVVTFYREDYPQTTTAIYATFDIDIALLELEIILTLDHITIGTIDLSVSQLDSIVSFFDKQAIEDMIEIGELDLDDYTYRVALVSFN